MNVTPIRHSYLTGVTAGMLRRRLSNMNVIQMIIKVLEINKQGLGTPTQHPCLCKHAPIWFIYIIMKASWYGNTFNITGPLYKGNHQSLVDSPHKVPIMQSCDIFFVVGLSKLFNKQLNCQLFRDAMTPMCCYCSVFVPTIQQRCFKCIHGIFSYYRYGWKNDILSYLFIWYIDYQVFHTSTYRVLTVCNTVLKIRRLCHTRDL